MTVERSPISMPISNVGVATSTFGACGFWELTLNWLSYSSRSGVVQEAGVLAGHDPRDIRRLIQLPVEVLRTPARANKRAGASRDEARLTLELIDNPNGAGNCRSAHSAGKQVVAIAVSVVADRADQDAPLRQFVKVSSRVRVDGVDDAKRRELADQRKSQRGTFARRACKNARCPRGVPALRRAHGDQVAVTNADGAADSRICRCSSLVRERGHAVRAWATTPYRVSAAVLTLVRAEPLVLDRAVGAHALENPADPTHALRIGDAHALEAVGADSRLNLSGCFQHHFWGDVDLSRKTSSELERTSEARLQAELEDGVEGESALHSAPHLRRHLALLEATPECVELAAVSEIRRDEPVPQVGDRLRRAAVRGPPRGRG